MRWGIKGEGKNRRYREEEDEQGGVPSDAGGHRGNFIAGPQANLGTLYNLGSTHDAS